MSDALRYFLWTILSIGLFFLAIMFFWIFLIIVGVLIVGRLIYMKLFNKGSVTFYNYSYKGKPDQYSGPRSNINEQEFTTVIDAEDMDKEYKIPKIK